MVARSCLEAYGLVAVLPEWSHATVAWQFVFALHGLRLWTIDSSAEDARELLGCAADSEHAKVTTKKTSTWLAADISIADLAIAATAFVLAGTPMPVWKRRLRDG